MRIVFVGTVKFSYRMLEKLLELGVNIVGVVTKEASIFNSDFANIGDFSLKHGLPTHYTKDINSPISREWIRSHLPDVIFCFGWSALIKTDVLKIPPLGVVGFHPAALPKNRGRHPLVWALVLGLKETASTFFFMDEGADSGDLLSQKIIKISHEDNAATLYEKMVNTALGQLEEFLPMMQTQHIVKTPQDHTQASYWRKRVYSDGKVDWRMSAESIYNLVRALTKPYVGAHIVVNDSEIKIWKTRIVTDQYSHIENIEYGKIVFVDIDGNSFDVKCMDGVIRVLHHTLVALPTVGEYLL
jgi:methionyl-tRNA formyltransferase